MLTDPTRIKLLGALLQGESSVTCLDERRRTHNGRPTCGASITGERYYDWAAVAVTVKDQPPADGYAHTC